MATASDSEFEGDDGVPPKLVKNAVLHPGPHMFLGQAAQIGTVQSMVCFMRHGTSSVLPCQYHHGGGGGGEIVVDYRYTRFQRMQRQSAGVGAGAIGDGAVDMHGPGPKQARLRFFLGSPLASDSMVSSSLRFAGAVLASLVYPARFSAQLQALWSVVTAPVPERVPAETRFILVTVDAGILRPGDFAPARMRHMCVALQSVASECAEAAAPLPDTTGFDIAAELRLPVVLRSEDDVRPKKGRRVTGEDCPICGEVLEEGGGLAAWPWCAHIFHDGCLEQHLLRGHQECPLCRSELKLNPTTCEK